MALILKDCKIIWLYYFAWRAAMSFNRADNGNKIVLLMMSALTVVIGYRMSSSVVYIINLIGFF